MVVVESYVKKWGNSLGIVIPTQAVKNMKIKEEDRIVVDILTKKRINGFGVFKGAKPFVREEDTLDRVF